MKIFLVILVLFPCLVFSQKKYDFKNLVFEGGGIRGRVQVGDGAAEKMREQYPNRARQTMLLRCVFAMPGSAFEHVDLRCPGKAHDERTALVRL